MEELKNNISKEILNVFKDKENIPQCYRDYFTDALFESDFFKTILDLASYGAMKAIKNKE